MTPGSVYRVVASSVLFAIAASSSAQSPAPVPSGENKLQPTRGIIFNTFGDGSEHVRKMRERLQDPQQRAALREEYRGYIVHSNYDVAEVLELDAATYEKLIELLTDQQMATLEEFHLRGFSQTQPSETASRMQSHAERQNRDIDALRDILGQEKLERFQAYQRTLGQRQQVRELDAYLKPGDKLSRTQKERLVELFQTHYQSFIQDYHTAARGRSSLEEVLRPMSSQEELQRRSQLMTIEANQDSWRRMPESDRRLREQAAAFLTASQLSALEQLHADKLQQLQQSIEQMRVQAGLSPTIPAAAEVAQPTPARVARDVRVRIKISVNRGKPASVTEVVSSGTPLTLELDGGLLVQATPIVFDNDTFELRVEYFEQGMTGNRLIGNMGTVGMLSRAPLAADAPMGGSSMIISGGKAYAIELSTSVEAT